MRAMSLSPAISATLSREVQGRLSKLEYWDLTATSRRTQQRMNWPASKRRIVEREYRRFLGLIVLNPDCSFGMAGEVDEFWHDHILDTEDYEAMCREVAGAFVHHRPIREASAKKRSLASIYDSTTRPALKKTYRGRVSRIWPAKADAAGIAKCCNH